MSNVPTDFYVKFRVIKKHDRMKVANTTIRDRIFWDNLDYPSPPVSMFEGYSSYRQFFQWKTLNQGSGEGLRKVFMLPTDLSQIFCPWLCHFLTDLGYFSWKMPKNMLLILYFPLLLVVLGIVRHNIFAIKALFIRSTTLNWDINNTLFIQEMNKT